MGRALAYVFVPAVLLAALALAYYSYTYSEKLATSERAAILEATRELAQEKIFQIESELLKAESSLLRSVELRMREMPLRLAAERPAVESVLILDANGAIVPGGFFTKRETRDATESFRHLFETKVLPELSLATLPAGDWR